MKVSWGKSTTVQFCNANMANLAIRIEVSARVKHMNFDDLVLLRLMKIPYPGPRLAYTSSINVIFSWRISTGQKMSQITEKKTRGASSCDFFGVKFRFLPVYHFKAIPCYLFGGILGFCFTSRASRYECENFALVRFAIVGDL